MKNIVVSLGIFCLLAFVTFLAISGGKKTMSNNHSCDEVFDRIDDEAFRSAVLDWADRNVMGRVFSSADFTIGHYSGPVIRTATLNASRAGVGIPSWMSGHEIRIMGDRSRPVELIYIGTGRYRGFLIGKNDLLSYSDNGTLKVDNLKRSGRIGAICYEDGKNP